MPEPLQRRRFSARGRFLGALAAAGTALGPGAPAAAQSLDPADTFRDPAAQALVLLARGARVRDVSGIDSYEGTLRQHIFVGVTAFRFRRERGIFEMERVARIRWSQEGDNAIHWLGARTAIPIAGIDTGRPGRGSAMVSLSDSALNVGAGSPDAEVEADMADDMLDETDVPGFQLNPGGDRLFFGDDDWALHPLADTAGAHYRYASGDTLRVTLPAPGRDVVLHEVRVEPRRADFNLVAGSLWFDAETHSLVRATYKPARPFDMRLDEPDDADDVPGFLQPIQAEISYVTVEYSFHEFRYWLPRRFAFEGEARIGGFFRIPITLEWNVGEYSVNEATTLPLAGDLPDGWRRQENVEENEDGDSVRVTVIVPTHDELREYPGLSADFGQRAPTGFTSEELEQLRGELEGLLPTYRRFRPQVTWGFRRDLLRYNRVEGLSVGAAATMPITPTLDVEALARIGTGDWEPGGSVSLRLGEEGNRWSASAQHQLRAMGDWTDPFGLSTSVGNLVFGADHGQYYRVTGVGLGREWTGRRAQAQLGVFHERQRAVALESNFFVLGSVFDDTLDAVVPARDVDVSGVRGSARWFSATDPNALIVTGHVSGEASTGGAEYQRASARLSASHPLPLRLAGALEVGAGAAWGDVPIQRNYFLGGAETLRGFHANEEVGPAYWRARAEIATGFAGARIGLFGDAGWAGPRDAFSLDDPKLGVGVGASLLDGLFRFDVARAARGGAGWRVHAYLDGLF